MLSKQPKREGFMSRIQGRETIILNTNNALEFTFRALGVISVSIFFLVISLSKPENNNKKLKDKHQDNVTVTTIPDTNN